MRNRSVLLVLFTVLALVIGLTASVSAQNVDNMSNEELTTLLLQIMQKLEQSEEPAETPEPTPTPTSVPTDTPQPELSGDRAELEALLMAVRQKLQQGQEPETAPETPSETMVPAEDPDDEPENSIWENKKLLIEALPSYMFIQPTKPSKPEKPGPEEAQPEHYENEPGIDEIDGGPCHWTLWEGKWYCMKG